MEPRRIIAATSASGRLAWRERLVFDETASLPGHRDDRLASGRRPLVNIPRINRDIAAPILICCIAKSSRGGDIKAAETKAAVRRRILIMSLDAPLLRRVKTGTARRLA